MNGEADVFQDFDSDASDVDDDVDWNFTDGESASALQLMGAQIRPRSRNVKEGISPQKYLRQRKCPTPRTR